MSEYYTLVQEGLDQWINSPDNGGECCQTSRETVDELNRLINRIKRLEKELTDTKRKQSVLVSDVVLYEDRGERIKQMEEVGDEMLNWLTDDGISMENLRLIANAWRKAKESTP